MFKKLLLGLFIIGNAFSAANVTTIPGSTAIQYYFRNYSYANMSLDLPILSMGLATDLNKIIYRNSIGNLYKVMVDASGSSNTPQNRVFYADVNGSATSSTNFTFNGTSIYINSDTAGSITTGRVSGTDGVFSDTVSGGTGYLNAVTKNTYLNIDANGTYRSGIILRNQGNILGYIYLYPQDTTIRISTYNGFDKIIINKNGGVKFVDSIQLGSGSYFKSYVEGTMPCTLKTSDVTVQQIGTAYYTKIGNTLHISFPVLEGTSNSTSLRVYCSLPYLPKQKLVGYNYSSGYFKLTNSGSTTDGSYIYTSLNPTYINMIVPSGFASSGIKGISAITIDFITE